MLKAGVAAMALLFAAGAAQAQGSTPAEIVQRHVSSGGNIDAIMADYADDAVVLQNGRAIQGKPAIRKLFEGMFGGGRAAPPPAQGAAPAGDRRPGRVDPGGRRSPGALCAGRRGVVLLHPLAGA